MASEATLELLGGVPLFAELDHDTLAFLASHMRRRPFRNGETLVRQDEPAQALYLVMKGRAKVIRLSPEGDETLLQLVGAGECIGDVAVLDGSPRSATVIAAEATETLVLLREHLLEAIRQNPQLALALISTLARRLRLADARLEDAYFSDLATRLARRLLQIAEQHGHATVHGIEVPLPLTQDELGEMVGGARSRVNQILGSFHDEGILRLEGRSVLILDLDALHRRAGR